VHQAAATSLPLPGSWALGTRYDNEQNLSHSGEAFRSGLSGGRRWLTYDAAVDMNAAVRFKAAVEHLRVKVDLARPFDRMGLRVDVHFLKQLARIADQFATNSARCSSSHS
jgi:hypothetical protein